MLNDELATEVTCCWVPITDLLHCTSALLVPIELTQITQAELKSTMDPRIWEQINRYYRVVDEHTKRLKPMIIKRNICI